MRLVNVQTLPLTCPRIRRRRQAPDGNVSMFIPPLKTEAPDGAMGEGIAIDPRGNLYTAEPILRGFAKYVAPSP